MSKPQPAALSLLLLSLLATLPALAETPRLNPAVAPTFEAIDLRVDAATTTYTGSVRIDLDVKEPVSAFSFHAEGQEIERLELSENGEPVPATWERGEEAIVTVTTARQLAVGPHRLEIDFSNHFNTQAVGLYRVVVDGTGYLFTQFEAVDARKAFPCWDEPIYKIPFQLTLEVPAEHEAVSNTPVESEEMESEEPGEGWRRVTFARTQPMPSYLLAMATGPLESVEIPGLSVPGRIYSVQGQIGLAAGAAAVTPPILAALENYFGIPYPYAKLDLIAVPEYWFGAMENAGAVVFRDELLLQDPATASVSARRGQAGVIAHELAHMWFGDLVTMSWWNDMWLNESFASWMGDKITEEVFPEFQVELTNRRGIQRLMSQDARPSTRPIRREIETLATIWEDLGLAYGKGKTVLGMIEQWIGEDVMQQGVRSYLARHAWSNAVANDLWTALSEASGKDLSPMLASFLNQSGLPLVTVSLRDGGTVRLAQRRFLNEGVEAPDQLWTLPVRLRLSVGGEVEERTVVLDAAWREIAVDGPVDWVYPDDGAFSYLRWEVPPGMFLEMAKGAGEILAPAERIAFLGNATALLDAGVLSGGDYLGVLRAFGSDTEPEVVSAVISGIDRVSDELVPTDASDLFAAYLRGTLSAAVERFGLEKRQDEPEAVSLFRPRLFTLLGDVGRDEGVRARATSLAKAYLADVDAVDPALSGAALEVAALEGDRGLFDTFRNRFESAATPIERDNFLGALGYFDDPEIQAAALDYNLGGTVRPTELFDIPRTIARNERGAGRTFHWMVENWDQIAARLPAMRLAFMPYFAGGCSTERLEEATDFFANPAHQVAGTLNTLTKVGEQVTDCVRLREREGPSVLRYLRQEPDVAAPDDTRG